MPKDRTIYDDLADEMADNGEMDTATREKYTILMLKQIGRDISKLTMVIRRVENLERYSIVLFCQKNPKTASIIAVLILILINFWFISDLRKFFLQLVGLPADLLP